MVKNVIDFFDFLTNGNVQEDPIIILLRVMICAAFFIFLMILCQIFIVPLERQREEKEVKKKEQSAIEKALNEAKVLAKTREALEKTIAEARKKEELAKQKSLAEERAIAKAQEEFNKNIAVLQSGIKEMTPKTFFQIRKLSIGKDSIKEYSETFDCSGVYILHNQTKQKYYVGQSVDVLKRVNQHFTGTSDKIDIYLDYKKGDHWTIKIIPLQDSGFIKLNPLEKHYIRIYDAYHSGYNKTQGNN